MQSAIQASSVTSAVLGEAAFAHLRMNGLRLLGRHFGAEFLEEIQPDAICSRCCSWGRVVVRCSVPLPDARFVGRGGTKNEP